MHRDDRLADFGDLAELGHLGGVLDLDHLALEATEQHLVDHARSRGDEILVELALEPLLHDLHVQQPEESAAKTETECLADFGLVAQGRIVELELLEGVAELVVFAGFGGVQAREHLRLDFLEAGQGLGGGAGVVGQLFLQRDGIAHFGRLQFLDAGDQKAHLAGRELLARHRLGREHADLLERVDGVGGHHADALAFLEHAVHHAHEHHHAHVVVEPGVDDHRPWRAVDAPARGRHAGNHRFDDVFDPFAGLGRAGDGVFGVDADDVFDFLLGALRVRLRQVHLVEDRHHLHTQLECGVAVRNRLGFHALAGIHHQQRPFAGRK